MYEEIIPIGEEALDTETGRSVWWDGVGWSPVRPVTALKARPRPKRIPLSYAQSRLWFLQQLAPGGTEYNIAQAMRLRGALSLLALEQAVNAIVTRHESLRTRFVEIDGLPWQVVDQVAPAVFRVEFHQGLDEPQRLCMIEEAAKDSAAEPFDLARGPLFRVKVLALKEDDHAVLITMHHIISDGWSSSVLSKELSVLYEAFVESRPDPLPPLAVQYIDFALWQRERIEQGGLDRGMSYWRKQLEGIPAQIELPLDRQRPPLRTFSAGLCVGHMTADSLKTLKRILQSNNASLYMGLLACFALLLESYTGQTDIVVGTPIANRLETQLEDLIGFFVNSLVMRVRIAPNDTFADLLAKVQRMTLEAYEYQEIPFERIVAELSPERGLNVPPLFQVVFALQNAPVLPQSLKSVGIEEILVGELQARFDLDVHVVEGDEGLNIYWLYNSDLFDRWRMEQMVSHFVNVIELVSLAPSISLRQHSVLSKSDSHRILEEFNPVRVPIPQTTTPMLIEEQVERTPWSTAIVDGAKRIAYRHFNERANRLAHHLMAQGVGPGSFVGICLNRSAEMVIALIAVLKAGGAYLPLDPAYPEARVAAMIEDAVPQFVLSKTSLSDRLKAAPHVIFLDDGEVQRVLADASPLNPHDGERTEPLLAEHPAYIIYTSGSTGRPKGVVVTHRSVITLAAWAGDLFTDEEWSGVLASTSICFDPSAFELLLTPIHGGTMIVADTALSLIDLPARDEVRLVNTVPSAAQALIELGAIPEGVRTVSLVGEKLPGTLVRGLYAQPQIERVYNLYGPTEDTVYSTTSLCPRDLDGDPDIGSPLWNTRAYLLDASLRPTPIGVAGDFYLAGDGLARCYWNRPSLTADRFPADPYGVPGGRMYRTGDRARWTVDGVIEFLGRSDHQVKIRGFRVEPGEIEALLSEQPDVAHQLVVARDDGPSGKSLIAYIVLREGAAENAAALRRELSSRLPDHMVPKAFVFLKDMPRTPNGKLDRSALPAARYDLPVSTGEMAPVSTMQQLVASVWSEVLKTEHIRLDHNFFETGGDSLSLVTVFSMLRRKVSEELMVVDLFRYPRVDSLASFLEELQGRPKEAAIHDVSIGGATTKKRAEKLRVAIQQRAALRAPRQPAAWGIER